MDSPQIPDLDKWTENLNERVQVEDKGNPIGFAKFFIRFDKDNPDKRIRKLMQRCMIFYAFNVDVVVKEWTVHIDDGNGKIVKILYAAILMDRINDKWSVGLPNEFWKPEVEYKEGKIAGMSFSLKTAEGVKSVYIKNPDRRK